MSTHTDIINVETTTINGRHYLYVLTIHYTETNVSTVNSYPTREAAEEAVAAHIHERSGESEATALPRSINTPRQMWQHMVDEYEATHKMSFTIDDIPVTETRPF